LILSQLMENKTEKNRNSSDDRNCIAEYNINEALYCKITEGYRFMILPII